MRQWKVTAKDGRSVVVESDDRLFAAKEGERQLGIPPFSGDIVEYFPVPDDGFHGILNGHEVPGSGGFWDPDDFL